MYVLDVNILTKILFCSQFELVSHNFIWNINLMYVKFEREQLGLTKPNEGVNVLLVLIMYICNRY